MELLVWLVCKTYNVNFVVHLLTLQKNCAKFTLQKTHVQMNKRDTFSSESTCKLCIRLVYRLFEFSGSF